MSWANEANRRKGDIKLLNRNGKEFVLIMSDGSGGFTEISSGGYGNMRAEYERLYSEENSGIYGNFKTLRTEQRGNIWDMQSDEERRNGTSDSESVGSQRLQKDTAGNNEHLRSSDNRISRQINTDNEASEQGAFSMPENRCQISDVRRRTSDGR